MFNLKHSIPRFVPISGLLLLFVTTEVSAQYFDTLIFKTYGYYWAESVIYMGYQNGDGCDDFMITKMDTTASGSEARSYFYYGGDPVPETPAFYFRAFNPISITACDINRDGYRDVISRTGTNLTYPISFLVYLGGPNLDTVPDYEILHPENSTPYLYSRDWPVDYDGDGWEEWVTFSNTGKFFFLKTTPDIQPAEYYVIKPDSAYSNYKFMWNLVWFVDLDGDGKTDFSPVMSKSSPSVQIRRFYYGNSDLDFSHYYQFSSDSVFQPQSMFLINDMNNNEKGEIIVYLSNSGSSGQALSYGSRPPDIIPEVTISTNGLGGRGVSPGDVNGDGYGDMLKFIPYDSYGLYLGGSTISGLVAKLYVSHVFLRDINFAGRVGDVNGDGIDDICVGENGSVDHQSIPDGYVYIYKGTRKPASVEEEVVEKTDEKNIEVAISPNPTNGKVTVRFTMPDSGVIQLKIYDMLGQEIFNKTLYKEKGGQTETINFKDITASTGIYILSLDLEKGGKHQNKNAKIQYLK